MTAPESKTLCYVYFSAAAAALCGSSIYLDCNNKEVEVTCVGKDLIDDGLYLWPDRKSTKPVVRWLRRGQAGSQRFEY